MSLSSNLGAAIRRARQLCAGLHEGEIVLFDKSYYELAHFRELAERGISFVTRAKDNIACRVRRRLPRGKDPRVLKVRGAARTSTDMGGLKAIIGSGV